jgi:putative transposase
MFGQRKLAIFCEVAIKECCGRNNIEVLELNVQAEHIHIVANLPRGMTDIKALQLLKGFTSFLLFKMVPRFRKRYPRGHLWSRGSFASTVGYTQLDIVVNYVRNQ